MAPRDRESDADRLLRTIALAVEAETGEAFFRSLVRRLAEALSVPYAFVSELTRGGTHFRTLALWERGAPGAGFEVPLAGTPCEAVLGGEARHHPDGLCARFPEDGGLVAWNARSYAGVPMIDANGRVVGHFAVVGDAPMPEAAGALAVMRIFAARAVAELERRRADAAREASERRLAAIVDSASDGIVSYGDDGILVVFNRSAERILRCRAEDALGTSVARFSTDEGARRIAESIRKLAADPQALVFAGEDQGVTARRADGTIFVQEASLSRADVHGRPLYTQIFRDVEERRRAGRALVQVERENVTLREELAWRYDVEEIVGRSDAMAAARTALDRVARTDATVLLRGETGTGKELFARALHARSPRHAHPLVKVSCAALAPGLVESELFGHERGAFTGAGERRIGRFELAHGGTIFLDEVGEIPLDVQVKLLRVLQEREIERVGGGRSIPVDVRVVAATNRDLEQAIANGTFREDLFYRLDVFPIEVPPLRERGEDIRLLAPYFIERHAARIGRRISGVEADTMKRLLAYDWPGNVRELENVIERAIILAQDDELVIGPELLGGAGAPAARTPPRARTTPLATPARARASGPAAPSLEEAERRHICATLRATGGRVEGESGAAARLGLRPSTLRSRMKKLGIGRGPVEPA